MIGEKTSLFTSSNICFVREAFGMPENDLKAALLPTFQLISHPLRTYLAWVEHATQQEAAVALCVAWDSGDEEKLVHDVSSVFRHLFHSSEHLDIIFITPNQELQLRKVCCPFFTSARFNRPDFYLTSSEGYHLNDVRGCYKEKRLSGNHHDGYMVCELDTPIIGQPYGLGFHDIHKVVIASRYMGHSIFSIKQWPQYVHVARILSDLPDETFVVDSQNLSSIAWAEIYESATTAARSK